MASKNVQALNNRLDLACRSRVDELYKQYNSAMSRLEHDKSNTAKLLQSVKKCPSKHAPLSIKFLGPPPPSRGHHNHQRRIHQLPSGQLQNPKQKLEEQQRQQQQQHLRQPPQTAVPSQSLAGTLPPIVPSAERSKTFAVADINDLVNNFRGSQSRQQKQRRRRARTPFPDKLEKFYSYLEGTKCSCGLSVVDSTQSPEARQFGATLSKADWRVKLAKLDPEFFKNLEDSANELTTHL